MTPMTWASADHRALVFEARQLAHAALAEALPRRWKHTIGVAAAAERLAGILAPQHATEITCAAWLHDIGYAPAAITTGFHPVDGAEYVTAHASTELALRTTSLIAHHSGALFEAHERGLQIHRGFPSETVELAILNAADLSTSPDGLSTDPAARLAEVLHRYPPEHPVHRAISVSQPVLLSQAQLILGAAKTAKYTEPQLNTPVTAAYLPDRHQWQAHWSGQHHTITATLPINATRGWLDITMPTAVHRCEPDDIADFADDLDDARAVAAGATLGWLQYRAFDVEVNDDGEPSRGPACTFDDAEGLSTFYLAAIAELHLNKAAEGRPILVQQRTFHTLSHPTAWVSLPVTLPGAPVELQHTRCRSCRGHHRPRPDPTRSTGHPSPT